MSDNEKNSLEESKDKVQERKNNIAKDVGKKVIKEAGKKGVKSVATKSAISSIIGAAAPVILGALVVLLVIFILVGIIAFFLTVPGLMMEKINECLNNIIDSIKSFYGSSVNVNDDDVIDLAKYIDGMDYDLIGYGFIKPITDNNIKVAEELVEEGYVREVDDKGDEDSSNDIIYYKNEEGNIYNGYFYDIDGKLYDSNKGIIEIEKSNLIGSKAKTNYKSSIMKNGIIYDSNGEDVIGFDKTKVDYSRLRTYALSNKRLFILRNSDTTFFAKIVKGITKLLTGYQGSWAIGMLEVYTADNGRAESLYDVWDKVKDLSTVEITGTHAGDSRLKLKAGFLNKPLVFNLDDWSSRYGLSSDFLVSLHLATLSPELIETMCQTFDIRAQVYLDHITNAAVHAYFYTDQMEADGKDPAYYEDMKDAKQDSGINPFDGWFLSKKEAKEIMDDFGIESLTSGKYTCGGKDPSIVWDYRQYSDEGTPTNKCFTEVIEDKDIPWIEDVIYNQWSDEKSMWTGDRSNTGKGGTLLYVEKHRFDTEKEREDEWEDKWNDFVDFLDDGDNRPGILYGFTEETSGYNMQNHADNSITAEVKLSTFLNMIDSIENAYNRVEQGVYDCNIVDSETKIDLSNLKYKLFDEESDVYIGNLMPYADLKNMGKDSTSYYEVVMNVWPTNDSGLKDGDPGYNSEEDGELVLSMLFRHTTVDQNYNVSWILYENLSLARMKEERIRRKWKYNNLF